MEMAVLLTIGEVSERSGVAQSTLRYYEREHLIESSRSAGGQRRYQREVLRRVAFIRAAQHVGLTLDEIRQALALLPSARTPTAADWKRLSQSWRHRLDSRIGELERLPGPARLLHRLWLPVVADLSAVEPGRRGRVPGLRSPVAALRTLREAERRCSRLGRPDGSPHHDMWTDDRIDPRLTHRDESRSPVERDRRHPGVAPEQPTPLVGDMGDGGPEHGTSDPEVAEVFSGRHTPEPPRGILRRTGLAQCGRRSLQCDPHRPDDGPVVADSSERSRRRVVVIGQGQLFECFVGAEHGLPQSPRCRCRDLLDVEFHGARVPSAADRRRRPRADRRSCGGNYCGPMTERIDALRATSDRLDQLVRGLDPAQIERSATPPNGRSQTCSPTSDLVRCSSSAGSRTAFGREMPDDFAQPVWDVWNAKDARTKAADGLRANRALVERLDSLTDQERAQFRSSMGPMVLDLDGAVGLRLNEVALHLWDIEVALDPLATLRPRRSRAWSTTSR